MKILLDLIINLDFQTSTFQNKPQNTDQKQFSQMLHCLPCFQWKILFPKTRTPELSTVYFHYHEILQKMIFSQCHRFHTEESGNTKIRISRKNVSIIIMKECSKLFKMKTKEKNVTYDTFLKLSNRCFQGMSSNNYDFSIHRLICYEWHKVYRYLPTFPRLQRQF